jgi:hypothetical protein
MKKYARIGLVAIECALILLVTSCVAEFLNPIPPPKNLKPDSALLGEWEMTEGESIMRMYIYPRPSGWIDIICIETGPNNKVRLDVYEGYSTRIKQERFLCLREREIHAKKKEDKKDQLGYFIGHYKITENDMFSFSLFDVEKIKTMVRQGELKGAITSGEKVVVTSKANELIALISKKGIDGFINSMDPSKTFIFSRPKK